MCLLRNLQQSFKPGQVHTGQRSRTHTLHLGSKTLQQMSRNEKPGLQPDLKPLHMLAKHASVPAGLQQLSPWGRVTDGRCLLPLHTGSSLRYHRST